MPQNTEFTIPKDGYLSFDALTLKQFIKDRLNETGVFTDQNYEGSYISTINEIIGYTFNTLLFYLNNTATESMFSEAQIYENMNRIVKLLDYKPIGDQTSTLTFTLTAGSDIDSGLYAIPRYSYIENGAKTYSFNEDIVFSKTETLGTAQVLDEVSSQKLLFQGKYKEYPAYTAVGNANEIIFFTPGDNIIIDHFNIDVFVKRDGVWAEWSNVPSLYLEDAFSKSYEYRLNENKRYEIKFGNGINGQKLIVGDTVAIYYLESNGTEGEASPHLIKGANIIPFATSTFNQIITDLSAQASGTFAIIDTSQARSLLFDNDNNSTYYQEEESVEDIRKNAPGTFRSQYRLVTPDDYENYISTNFANLIHDVKVANNWEYVSNQLKYYYDDVGLKDPNNVSNVLYNQLNFADGCNFNNIYLTVVPKTITNSRSSTVNLTPAQKELIISSIQSVKTLTSETVILDPVYIASDVCISADGSPSASVEDIDKSELYIVQNPLSRRDSNSIIVEVEAVFASFFSRENLTLGSELDITKLTNEILSIEGVDTFYTRRTDNPAVRYNGLSMLVWNPIYIEDTTLTTKNVPMEYFKYLFLYDKEHFTDKISVQAEKIVYESIEY